MPLYPTYYIANLIPHLSILLGCYEVSLSLPLK